MRNRRWCISFRCPRSEAAVLLFALHTLGCDGASNVTELKASLHLPATEISMGKVFVSYPSTKEVLISSRGDFPLDFVVQVLGPESDMFRISPLLGSIPANGSTTLTVTAGATRIGKMTIQIHVASNANVGAPAGLFTVTADAQLPPDCEDGNGCTIDRFDPEAHKCLHLSHEKACDDRNRCTHNDRCREGECRGEALECDDDNLCTDNLCNPLSGCVFPPTRSCDDRNPCTIDSCLESEACAHTAVEDGTLCDDFELCTQADLCTQGVCTGIPIPDGTSCDDGDPCSKNEVCSMGECLDENYQAPGLGEIKFDTAVPALSNEAGRNLIVDRDGHIFLGLRNGLLSLDACGDMQWENETLGAPRWRAALSLPGRIFVPTGSTIHVIDSVDGVELDRINLHAAIANTSSATQTLIKDMAVQADGSLIVSIKTWNAASEIDGFLLSWTPGTEDARILFHWPFSWAEQLAIGRTEILNAVLTQTSSISPFGMTTRLTQFDLHTLNMLWTSSATVTEHASYLALGRGPAVAWSIGRLFHSPAHRTTRILPSQPFLNAYEAGAPIFGNELIYWPFNRAANGASMGQAELASELVASSTTGEIKWRLALDEGLRGSSGVLGRHAMFYLVSNSGRLLSVNAKGQIIWDQDHGRASSDPFVSNPTLTPQGVLVFALEGRVIGIQTDETLNASPWPRIRHDNLATSHR